MEGAFRFLNRVWRFFQANRAALAAGRQARRPLALGRAFRRTVHETIQRVTTDIDDFHFNTAISALHEARQRHARLRDGVARPGGRARSARACSRNR